VESISEAESWQTRLVGSNDLQGRESLQVTLKGDWCYVGHLPGRALNPATGIEEPNGTSIIDVSDPTNPKLTHHIPAASGANCRAVQVIHSPRDGRFLRRPVSLPIASIFSGPPSRPRSVTRSFSRKPNGPSAMSRGPTPS